MITHPFAPDLSHLQIDELQNKIAELNKHLNFASRNGNRNLVNQISILLNNYHQQYDKKLNDSLEKQNSGNSIRISN